MNRRASSAKVWLLVAMAVPLCSWMLYEAQRTFRADWASAATRHNVLRWLSTDTVMTQADFAQAHADLQRSIALTPQDPLLHERLGDLFTAAGRRDWDKAAVRNQHFLQAVAAYQASLALRQRSASAWAGLAVARQALGGSATGVHQAWARAQALGPFEGHVQPVLLQVALADWNGASPAMQAWAKALFDGSDGPTRAQINALARHYGLQFAPDADTPAR